MSLTCGFYNSSNHDRKYDAIQISSIFDGIIQDGVFATIGDKFMVKSTGGYNFTVGTGRAWNYHTWTYNDALYPMHIDPKEIALDRIDTVVLEIDSRDRTRNHFFKVIKGSPAVSPKPHTIDTGVDKLYWVPLANIYVDHNKNDISQANITNLVGSSQCPYVTGILKTTNIDDLYAKWDTQFTEWFDDINNKLDDGSATALQKQIDNIFAGTEILTKTEYDKDYNGIVDNADKLAGRFPSFFASTDSVTVYRCVFKSSGWSKSSDGRWFQTAYCEGMSKSYDLTAPWILKTGDADTDYKLQTALSYMNAGYMETVDNGVKAIINTTPVSSDVPLYFRRVVTGGQQDAPLSDYQVDDTKFTNKNLLSAKGIADQICSEIISSGNVVTLDRCLKGYPMDISVVLPINQNGTGDPSPTNVRKITPYTIINQTRCGKNLLPNYASPSSDGGLTWHIDTNNNRIIIDGVSNRDVYVKICEKLFPAGTYTLSGCPKNEYNGGISLYAHTNDKYYLNFGDSVSITLDKPSNVFISIKIGPNIKLNNAIFSPQLEVGSTSTAYEPYNGNEYALDIGDDYYSGTIDFYHGEALSETGVYILNSVNSELRISGDGTDFVWPAPYETENIGYNCVSSIYPTGYNITGSQNRYIVHSGKFFRLSVKESGCGTLQEFKDLLNRELLQILYKRKVPIVSKIDDQDVVAIQGLNNIFNPYGVSTVKTIQKYKSDVSHTSSIGYIDDAGNIILNVQDIGVYEAIFYGRTDPIPEYDPIKIHVDATSKSTHEFISANHIPVGTEKILIKKGSSELGYIDILKKEASVLPSDKKYSFLALSDIHIVYDTAKPDFERALTYAENNNIAFTCISGDLTDTGGNDQLQMYGDTVKAKALTKKVYEVTGNHEGQQGVAMINAFNTYTGKVLYYVVDKNKQPSIGDDVFIMLGIVGDSKGHIFDYGELQWLYEILEKNRNKRCFIFEHVFPEKGCGNADGIYPWGLWGGEEAVIFDSLLSHYHNVIFFHGHSHLKFYLQGIDARANYDNMYGCHNIHIPSLASPRDKPTAPDTHYTNVYADSEGYVVDVYRYGIQLKGRDFVNGKFLPVATYWLDTKTKFVDEGTYKDPTNTLRTPNNHTIKVFDAIWHKGHIDTNTGAPDGPDRIDDAYTDHIKPTSAKVNVIKCRPVYGVEYRMIYFNPDGSVMRYVKIPSSGGYGAFQLVNPKYDFMVIGKTGSGDSLETWIKPNISIEEDTTYEYVPLTFHSGKLDYHTDGSVSPSDSYIYTDEVKIEKDYIYYIQTHDNIEYDIKKMYFKDGVYTKDYTEIKNTSQHWTSSVDETEYRHHAGEAVKLRVWFNTTNNVTAKIAEDNIIMYRRKNIYQY